MLTFEHWACCSGAPEPDCTVNPLESLWDPHPGSLIFICCVPCESQLNNDLVFSWEGKEDWHGGCEYVCWSISGGFSVNNKNVIEFFPTKLSVVLLGCVNRRKAFSLCRVSWLLICEDYLILVYMEFSWSVLWSNWFFGRSRRDVAKLKRLLAYCENFWTCKKGSFRTSPFWTRKRRRNL